MTILNKVSINITIFLLSFALSFVGAIYYEMEFVKLVQYLVHIRITMELLKLIHRARRAALSKNVVIWLS